MMTLAPGTMAVLAAEVDGPVPYIQRTRDYYLIRHARYFILHLAESPLTRHLLGQILGLIVRFNRFRFLACGQ